MNQNLQPGLHPDPDQLSIFVEGAATERERERMLTHLAECEECRQAVFLMQEPEKTPYAQEGAPRVWIWRRWLLPAGLAAAAVACGLMVTLVHVSSRRDVGGGGQIAVIQKPEFPKYERKPGGAVGPNAPKTGSAMPLNSLTMKAAKGPAISSSRSSVNSATAAEVPLNDRSVANLHSLAAPPSAQSITGDNSVAQKSLPALRVERPSGQNDAFSGVSGRVTDVSGAVIPQATVALRDKSGSIAQTTATSVDGSFLLTGIPAGHYDLMVVASGFRSNQQSIDLKPSELAMLQPVLNVGGASETVTVTSSAPLLQTESASIASVVAELPSRLPVSSSVSLGKRILSLDRAGSLFVSHNAGKNWKKVNPQWTGKATSIDIEMAEPEKAKRTGEQSSLKSPKSVFQLTTDMGAHWISKDGMHWRPE